MGKTKKEEVKKKKQDNKKRNKKDIEKDKINKNNKEKNNNKNIDNQENKGKYVFIYIFMAIMLIALISLVFVIVNEKYSLIYKNPIATIEIEEYGTIKIELEPAKAPNTVNHFIKLVEDGYYDNKVIYGKDGVSLHFGRGERGEEIYPTVSMVDKTVDRGSKLDFAYEIDGEFERNNFKGNDIKHEKYVVSLVRADYSSITPKIQHYSYNSGTGMFKILIDDAPGMNGNYAAFGRVIEGKDVIDKISERKLRFEPKTEEDKADLNEFDKFIKIKSINVNTFGKKFKEVKLHERFEIEDFLVKIYENYL